MNAEPFLEVASTAGLKPVTIRSQLVGDYNLPNILCAVLIGKYFKVPEEKIKNAIENYAPSNSRSQLIQSGSNHIILDAYNANPSSMKAAIENFAHLQAGKKVLILGGMMELGDESLTEHQALIELIKQYEWKEVVLVGGDFAKVAHGFIFFSDAMEAGKWLHKQLFENAYLLIKGSRSMQMEKVLER